MEFEEAYKKITQEHKLRVKKFTTARIRKDTKERVVKEMGMRPQQALELALYWHREREQILKAMVEEIKKLGDRVKNLEQAIRQASGGQI